MTGFRLTPPRGVALEAETKAGWSTAVQGRTLVWTGAGIAGGGRGRFAFRAHLPDNGRAITFQAEESYPSVPRSGQFPLRVVLTDEAAIPPSSGNASLLVGLVAGDLLVLAIVGAVLLPRIRRAS